VKNIIFSSTRQWNPGDEFILDGVRRLLNGLGVAHNAILFNRHPDVRSQVPQPLRTMRLPEDFHLSEDSRLVEANLKVGFFDNSVRPGADGRHVDWVVLSGTPEWCNGRLLDLYNIILRDQLPLMILGVGGDFDLYDERFLPAIAQAKAFVVRDANTQKAVEARGFKATLLPCPALFSAPPEKMRTVTEVRRLVLIYHATVRETVIWNGFSEEAYLFMRKLYTDLIAAYRDRMEISFVCHYADELPLALRDFPGFPVTYSYDARDYYDLYGGAGFVVGPRVHGIGVSASMGIPGVALTHNARGSTCAGFLAPQIPMQGDTKVALQVIRKSMDLAPQRSLQLHAHREESARAYQEIITRALADPQVTYPAASLAAVHRPITFRELLPLAPHLRQVLKENGG